MRKFHFMIAVITLMMFTGCATQTSTTPENKVTTNDETSDEKSSKDDSSEDTKTEETSIKFNKNGNISENVTLKVNDAKKTNKIPLYNNTMYSEPSDEDGTFIVVNVTLKNTGKKSEDLNYLYFNLIGPDEEEYVPTTIVGADDNFLTLNAINPKMKETGNIAFQVPKDAKISKYKLCYSGGLFSEEYYFNLK